MKRVDWCPWITLTLVLVAGLSFADVSWGEWLAYERGAVERGELWRLLSCHLAHRDARQLFWDLLPFLLVGGLAEESCGLRYPLALALAVAAIPLSVHLLLPACPSVLGLSGLDYAVFMLLASHFLRGRGSAWVLVFAALMVLNLGVEVFNGYSLQSHGVALPGPLCHFVGALVGLVIGLWPEGGLTVPGLRIRSLPFCSSSMRAAHSNFSSTKGEG
ncbi:MAG: rhomboid family intramembrane serine protease [Planctomycetota bacterium]|jgi:membrane associated rhomboid family serine protease